MIERTSFGLRNHVLTSLSAPSSAKFLKPGLPNTGSYLAVGNSKSYGDVGLLSNGLTISTRHLNRLISFDGAKGELICQPGVLLAEIQSIFVRQGWMLPVTPGTALISVGGAIANDVHGKDHHTYGTFGEHVTEIVLLRSTGEILKLSPSENSDLFRATIGGLGLTGMILSTTIRLKRVAGPFIDSETIPFGNLQEFFELSKATEAENWQSSVAWFDCSTRKAGRGSFMRGNPSDLPYSSARDDELLDRLQPSLQIPLTPPLSLVNKLTLDAFNVGYFHLQRMKKGKSVVHFKNFYYPLDGIGKWNRIYGPRGFYQYQSVIPMDKAEAATGEMLDAIRKSGEGSFLGVLKTFAKRKPAGLLSFAREGVTLALDFPDRGATTEALFRELDNIVSSSGGRLNPSKDGRMPRAMFENGYPELPEFLKFRDPGFMSEFSRRLID
jgi:FAD/FMN-containing dehydrogenase